MSRYTLQVVDAQLAAAEAKLLDLRRRKNAMSPTHHLPPEILLRILCFASDDVLNGYRRTLWVSRLSSWITVTMVCHQWREVALSAPTYWADISLHTPSWMRETLARSKSALIRLNYVSASYKEFVLEPLKQLARVSDLTLMQDKLMDWYLPILRDQPAPNLRVLRLGPQIFYDILRDTPCFDLGDQMLFAGELPRLHTLDLSMLFLSPKSPLFAPHLRYLSYTNVPEDKRMSMRDLLEALSRMSELEHLLIHNALPIIPLLDPPAENDGDENASERAPPVPVTSVSGDPLSLPKLRNLVVYDKNVRNIPAFLQNVTLSLSAAVTLKAFTSRISETASTLEPMHKHLLDAAGLHTHTFATFREDIEQYHDLYWGGNCDNIGYQESSVLTLSAVSPEANNEFAFTRKPNLDQLTPTMGKEPVHYGAQLSLSSPELSKGLELLVDVFSRYPATPANLTRISIENISLSEDEWRGTFMPCRNVIRVTTKSNTAAALIRALLIEPGQEALFPGIQTLCFALVDLRTLNVNEGETTSLTALYRALALRAHFKAPLGILKLKKCDIHVPEFHQQFHPLLRQGIIWDQEEFGFTDHYQPRDDELEDEDEVETESEDGDGAGDVNMDN